MFMVSSFPLRLALQQNGTPSQVYIGPSGCIRLAFPAKPATLRQWIIAAFFDSYSRFTQIANVIAMAYPASRIF
jgi:hypothetical protein